ncbi:MAG: hypothetical protein WEE89_11180 [Gemmatimonadota bacterium]
MDTPDRVSAGFPPARADDAEIMALVDSFERCVVPREEWNHRAHLVYALVMLLRHGPVQGAREIREGILRYNRVQGIEQTLSSGYHETLTAFHIEIVQRFVEKRDVSRYLHELAEELWTRFGDPELPYRYYSREVLSSWEARTSWMEPDLMRLW